MRYCCFLQLSQSAHICQEIQAGPYRGMNEHDSAVRVATTMHSYFNYLEEKVEEGEYSYNEIPPGAHCLLFLNPVQ